MNNGKERCEHLRLIRMSVAEKYGLDYTPTECNHEGPCSGTCPLCDAETQEIERQLAERGIELIEAFDSMTQEWKPLPITEEPMFMGMPALPFSRPTKERKLYKECKIAGITFHNLNDIWDELYAGARLALVRQKHNRHDKNAIAVTLADDYIDIPKNSNLILGYVPRTENEHLAAMIDLGWEEAFECEISQVNGYNPYKGSIYMKVYMVSREDRDVTDNESLLLSVVNRETFNAIESDLLEMGITHFRWLGFPHKLHNYPNRGDKVVIMMREDNNTNLYLMHCLAAGDDEAAKYLEDENLNAYCDDCCCYVFSNVKGPITIQNHELDFIDSDISNFYDSPEYLSAHQNRMMRHIFDL